ncbi:MAG: PQQ-binding-like beta-propeller repeat protein, partial [Anaerolineae bacterium]|nr:PQQ-binding-like beta-propeller repeat protein [Anaerolineae bacterium]
MTFVRGVERDPALRADEDRSSRDRPGGRSFLRGDRTPPFKSLWQHLTTNKLYAVAMTRDKRFIIAGGQSGDVLFMDMAGRLLWTGRTAGVVNRIALAEDADSFITSTLQRGHKAYRWHYSGRLLHTYETEGSVWGIATTPDASLVVLGSEDKHLYAFDQHDELLFKRELDEPIRQVAVTADGALIFASSDDQHVYAFDRAGEQRWRFQTEGRVYAGVRVADEARVLVAGSNDGHVYGLDFEGNERWRFQTGDLVNALAITPDGQFCAAGGKSATAYLLDDQGEVLWSTQTEEAIYGLDLSPDGQYMVVGANDSAIYLFDYQRNRRVIKEKLNGRIYAVALSADAQYIAAASSDQKVYAYQYTDVDGDGQELTRPASKPHSRLVVGGVREEYARSSHAGLVGWFSEFEKSLRYQQFDICRALLDEAHEENSFNLSEGEMRFTRSLEGAYWLFRGIAHHRQEQYDEARACYEQSKTIQEALHNQDGVGQVIAVLSLLGEQEPAVDSAEDSMEAAAETMPEVAENTTEGEIAADTAGIEEVLEALEALETTPGSPRLRTTAFHRSQQAEMRRLLDEILNKPRVLGMSEKLLEQRITEVPPTEQHQIILLARQSGVIAP